MVTSSKEHIRRTVPLRVKLSPDIAGKLDAIARPRGLTAATMGALAVGEFVEKYERTRERIGGVEGSSAGAEAAAPVTP
jgi:predicted transcriptional regulator